MKTADREALDKQMKDNHKCLWRGQEPTQTSAKSPNKTLGVGWTEAAIAPRLTETAKLNPSNGQWMMEGDSDHLLKTAGSVPSQAE
jgi:hypothetical protein